MNENQFLEMLKEAGFDVNTFVELLGYKENSVNNWFKIKYPSYVKPILEWAIKAKKYKELMQENSKGELKLQFLEINVDGVEENIETRKKLVKISKLEKENERLKKNIIKIKKKVLEIKEICKMINNL